MYIDKNYQYSKERFDSSIGTKDTFMSNFHQLKTPIIDEFGNKFWNSEGYYMSLRTNDINIKKKIADDSVNGGYASRKARKLYKLFMNEDYRAQIMLKVIQAKFKANTDLAKLLIDTKDQEIIEKNYWGDTLFGVDDKTLKGANILGKCLMQVREEIKNNNSQLK